MEGAMWGKGSAKALTPNENAEVLEFMAKDPKPDAPNFLVVPILRDAIEKAMVAKGYPCDANSARVTAVIEAIGVNGFGRGNMIRVPDVEAGWTITTPADRKPVLELTAAWIKG